jgi:eukaryotic-like serine/threonine-protein kinase
MSQPASHTERDDELDEVLAVLMENVERGQHVDPSEWQRRYPQFAAQIDEFFAEGERLETVLKALSGPPTLPARVPECGARFGDYEIIGELARGGMGLVFEARQVSLNRVVALKMILSGHLASPEERQRFRLEAERVAGLDHPNIVPVYEVGEHEGWLFYSMKLIECGNLAALELHRPLPRHEQLRVAALVATVADAVSHAHQRGLLHRDLKPANILLDKGGNPHVADFGLAKRLGTGAAASTDTPSTDTPSGTAVGTPSYMAPEQALRPKEATTAADIYSLGCMLYELQTGQPPFRAETPFATLLDVLERRPEKPRALCPTLDRDLETICLKCLEQEPSRRYASAAELAADLRRFMGGVPVQARAVGFAERGVRWCQRHPLVACLCASLLTLAAGSFALVTWQWRRAEANFEIAQIEKSEADRQTQLAHDNRRLAEERLQLAHTLVDEFCLRLSEDRLKDIPGTQAVRRELLGKSRSYLQDFVRQSGDDPRLRLKLAEARYSLALVLGSLGARQDALAELHACVKGCGELLQTDPENLRIQAALARALHRIGLVAAANGQPAEALDSCGRGHALFVQLAAKQPQSLRAQGDLAEAGSQLGNIHRGRAEFTRARAFLEASLALRRRILAMKPGDPGLQFNLAATCFNCAGVLSDLQQRAAALDLYREAHDLCETLVAAYPADPVYQRQLAQILLILGENDRLTGDLERSAKTVARARDIVEKLAAANPQVVHLQQELAAIDREMGHHCMKRGKKGEARACYARARDRLEAVVG